MSIWAAGDHPDTWGWVQLDGHADDIELIQPDREHPAHPTDRPRLKAIYRRRNDAESINRALDDTLWLRRAHSIGHQRQHLNQLTHALG